MFNKLYGIWLEGRNTCVVREAPNRKEAIAATRNSKCAGCKDAPIVKVAPLVGKDLKDAEAGKWVRTRADGSRNTSTGDYKFRPGLRNIQKGRSF